MNLGIVNTGIPLLLSTSFVSEVERILDANVKNNVALAALFLSRLIKGLQNLSHSDGTYSLTWGQYFYEVEDIGKIVFEPLVDAESGEKSYHVLSIRWTFSTSRFFSSFVY